MSNELMRYVDGSARVDRYSRQVTERARVVHDRVRLSAFKADGVVALAGHIMEEVVGLDNHRRMLAGDDPLLNNLLAGIESQAVYSVKRLQANLDNDWNL